jgi:hypothetical protein
METETFVDEPIETPNGRLLKPRTQNYRVVRCLMNGVWWSTAQLHEATGILAVHSRISDLDKAGYTIERRHRERTWWYRLAPALETLFDLKEVAA